jgi:hypothetical protein
VKLTKNLSWRHKYIAQLFLPPPESVEPRPSASGYRLALEEASSTILGATPAGGSLNNICVCILGAFLRRSEHDLGWAMPGREDFIRLPCPDHARVDAGPRRATGCRPGLAGG